MGKMERGELSVILAYLVVYTVCVEVSDRPTRS